MSGRGGSESRSERSSMSPGERRSAGGSPKRSASPAREGSRSRSRSRPKDSPPRESNGRRSRSRSRSRSRGDRRSRSRDYGRGRYRSRSRSPYRRRRYSRSRSRSPHYRGGRRGRSRSTSPMSSRRRHQGNRDNPRANRCVGVFGLSLYTQERDLRDAFTKFGPIDDLQIVYDHQSGRSRGFGFIYFKNEEDALEAKERGPGMEIDGRKIRVDYSITERAHTPTPGIYLGKPTTYSRHSRRSPSPYERRDRGYGGGRDRDRGYGGRSRYSRSRSRSYSPRRY